MNSGWCQPAPNPRINLPSLTSSRASAILARSPGLRNAVHMTRAPSSIRSVASASASRSSRLPRCPAFSAFHPGTPDGRRPKGIKTVSLGLQREIPNLTVTRGDANIWLGHRNRQSNFRVSSPLLTPRNGPALRRDRSLMDCTPAGVGVAKCDQRPTGAGSPSARYNRLRSELGDRRSNPPGSQRKRTGMGEA